MLHLGSIDDKNDPSCYVSGDYMHTLKTADPTKGETVTCPRCLAIMSYYDEENTDE